MIRRLLRWVADRRSATNGDDGDGSIWNITPEWQYTGLHAESGGISRAEQEQSLAEIQEQADAERQFERDSR